MNVAKYYSVCEMQLPQFIDAPGFFLFLLFLDLDGGISYSDI